MRLTGESSKHAELQQANHRMQCEVMDLSEKLAEAQTAHHRVVAETETLLRDNATMHREANESEVELVCVVIMLRST